MYPGSALVSKFPLAAKAIETAGLMWAPEIGWKIIIAVKTANPNVRLMANGGQFIATDPQPSKTIKNVPPNSAKYRFHIFGTK